eukprot:333397_1
MSLTTAVRFRYLITQLTNEERTQFIHGLLDTHEDIIMTSLFQHLSKPNQIDEVNNLNESLADIIQSRKDKPNSLSTQNRKLHQLPRSIIGHTASFLNQCEYTHFSIANRCIYLGCTLPSIHLQINLTLFPSIRTTVTDAIDDNQSTQGPTSEFCIGTLGRIIVPDDSDAQMYVSCAKVPNNFGLYGWHHVNIGMYASILEMQSVVNCASILEMHEYAVSSVIWLHWVLSMNHIFIINGMRDKSMHSQWILWSKTKYQTLYLLFGNDLHDMVWYELAVIPGKISLGFEQGVDMEDWEESMEMGGSIIKQILRHNNKGLVKIDGVWCLENWLSHPWVRYAIKMIGRFRNKYIVPFKQMERNAKISRKKMDKTKYANAEVFNNYFGVQHYPIGMQLILAELDKYTLNQSVDELPKIAQMVNAKQDDDTDDESEAKEHDENKANETIELDMDEHDEEAKEIEENTTTNNRISRISPTGGQANSKAKTGNTKRKTLATNNRNTTRTSQRTKTKGKKNAKKRKNRTRY